MKRREMRRLKKSRRNKRGSLKSKLNVKNSWKRRQLWPRERKNKTKIHKKTNNQNLTTRITKTHLLRKRPRQMATQTPPTCSMTLQIRTKQLKRKNAKCKNSLRRTKRSGEMRSKKIL